MKKEELLKKLKYSFEQGKIHVHGLRYDLEISQEEFQKRIKKLDTAENQIIALISKSGQAEGIMSTKKEMKRQFYIIVDKKSKLGAISTGHSPERRFVFERKGEADYYSLDWDGDVVKKAILIWNKNRGKNE